jgi:AcrR family transcriptional regulator
MQAMKNAKPGRPRLADRHRAQRTELIRQEIVDAAVAEFTTRGYHETSLAHIAERLGTGPSTIYNYFTSKREILEQTVDHALTTIVTLLAGIQADPPRTLDEFRATANRFGDALAELMANEPELPRMLVVVANSTDPELQQRWTNYYGIALGAVTQALADGARAGYFRREIDPEATAASIIAIPFGLLVSEPSLVLDADRVVARVRATVTLVTDGIGMP